MPPKIKFGLSVVTLIVAAAGFWFQREIGMAQTGWVVAFLGVFMVVSLWVFPEVTRKGESAKRLASGGAKPESG